MNRLEIYNKYNGHCAYCGFKIEYKEMQVDHIIPKRNFIHSIKNNFRIPSFLKHLTIDDLNHRDNLNPSCRKCNKHKDTFDIETFRNEIKNQIKQLNKHSTQYQRARKYGLVEETNTPVAFYFEKYPKLEK